MIEDEAGIVIPKEAPARCSGGFHPLGTEPAEALPGE
jgi:hypothetical protein